MNFLLFSNMWWGTTVLSAIAWPALLMNLMAVLIFFQFSSHQRMYSYLHAWKGMLHVFQSLWMAAKYSPIVAIQDMIAVNTTSEGCRYFVFMESFAPPAQAIAASLMLWEAMTSRRSKNTHKTLYLGLIFIPSFLIAYSSSFGNNFYSNRYCSLATMATLWMQLMPILGLMVVQLCVVLSAIFKDDYLDWTRLLYYFVHLMDEILCSAFLCLSLFSVSEGILVLILSAISIVKFVDGLNLFGDLTNQNAHYNYMK